MLIRDGIYTSLILSKFIEIMFSIIFITFITLTIIGNVSTAPATETGLWNIKAKLPTATIGVINTESDESTILEQNGDLFEGDMIRAPMRARSLILAGNTIRWPQGIVPYEISSSYSTADRTAIISAMRQLENSVAINNVRCVQFRLKVTNDQYFIRIISGSGCSSYVGQNTGIVMDRTVSLQTPGCIYSGIIMHELLHTLGFLHEQSRPDRDAHILINTANILSDKLDQFTKYSTTNTITQNIPYDYQSVMHYEKNSFSSNGLPTIAALQPNVKFGQRYFLSSSDVAAIRKFYNCSGVGTTLPPPTTTTPAPNPSVVTSTYTSALTSADPSYTRPNGLVGNRYYYESIEVRIPSAGVYYFQSNNQLDTYGSVYQYNFNPSNPSENLLLQNDDQSSINWNFRFGLNFPSAFTITVVVSTYNPNTQGPFTLVVTGPSSTTFVRRSP